MKMTNRLICAAALAAVALAPRLAAAAVTEDNFLMRSTADLVALCTADPAEPMGTAAVNFCHGFSTGSYRVLMDVQTARKLPMFCMPSPGPTRTESIAAFSTWANASPARLSSPAEDSILGFLVAQYPCPKKSK
jgi:hypothetical protein